MEVQAKQSPPVPWRRRLFHFSLRRLLLLVLLCALGFGWPHVWRLIQFQRLKGYAGQDLRKLSEPESAKFAAIANTVRGFEQAGDGFGPDPWYVWQIVAQDGDPLTILFEGKDLHFSPGNSGARVCVFGRFGNKCSDVSFSTGDDIFIHDAQWQPADDHIFDRIIITTSHSFAGADIATQYYARIGHEFALVRLEDSQGRGIEVRGRSWGRGIGPEQPTRSEDQWAEALESPNRGEVLRTLVWLAGFWPNPSTLHGPNPHNAESERVAARVRSRPDVQAALRRLASDADSWFSTAAQAALAVPAAAPAASDADGPAD